MDRCWLKGVVGDALHTVSCAAGYNLRWLLRAFAKLGIGPALLCLLQMVLLPAMALRLGERERTEQRDRRLAAARSARQQRG